MEVISIERSTYEVIGLPLRSKNCWRASTVSSQRWRRWLIEVTIWQTNSFTNPSQFAFWPNLNFFILPRIAFISGRNALIFQNRFAFTSFFITFWHIVFVDLQIFLYLCRQLRKELKCMPRKNSGMWYEVHPTPVKGEDGRNIVYVRPKSGMKLNMKQLEEYCERMNYLRYGELSRARIAT